MLLNADCILHIERFNRDRRCQPSQSRPSVQPPSPQKRSIAKGVIYIIPTNSGSVKSSVVGLSSIWTVAACGGGPKISGRNSCREIPLAASTPITRLAGIRFAATHCCTACGLTPIFVARLVCPPARRTTSSSLVSVFSISMRRKIQDKLVSCKFFLSCFNKLRL